jgi:hypothetical protein
MSPSGTWCGCAGRARGHDGGRDRGHGRDRDVMIVMSCGRDRDVVHAQPPGALVQHHAADPDDGKPEIAPSTGNIFSGKTYCERNSVVRPRKNTLMVWVKVTMPPRKMACLNGAARAHQVGRHDGLAMAGRKRVHASQAESDRHSQQDQPEADIAAMQQARQEIAAHDGARSGRLRRNRGGGAGRRRWAPAGHDLRRRFFATAGLAGAAIHSTEAFRSCGGATVGSAG